MIKVAVRITPKPEVLDTAGRTLQSLLEDKKFPVTACSYGKYIELSLNVTDSKQALKQAKEIAESVLHNKLIETFELEIISQTKG